MNISRYTQANEFYADARHAVLQAIAVVQSAGRTFHLGVSGGRTPRRLFNEMALWSDHYGVDWRRVHFYWVDERFVAHEHTWSNFGLFRDTFLMQQPVRPELVHPVDTAFSSAGEAAIAYEKTLRNLLPRQAKSAWPHFDLLLLGMGDDGHTASLFPGRSEVEETLRWVVAVPQSPTAPHVPRVTLTLPVLNAAARCFMLVSGAAKVHLIDQAQKRRRKSQALPAMRVEPAGGMSWFVLDDHTGTPV